MTCCAARRSASAPGCWRSWCSCWPASAAYGFTHVFSGRAAFVHIGAFLGTIMAANVFFIIIPNQKKVVAALIAGQTPDPALGKRAKQRSLHNNYLTLPVVLMMISNHYPMMFEHAHSWLIVAGILLFSGLVRLYANLKNAGAAGSPVTAILFYAAMVGMGAIGYASYRPGADLAAVGPVTFADVQAIMAHRCQACHSATPDRHRLQGAAEGRRLRHRRPDPAHGAADRAHGGADPSHAARQQDRHAAGGAAGDRQVAGRRKTERRVMAQRFKRPPRALDRAAVRRRSMAASMSIRRGSRSSFGRRD